MSITIHFNDTIELSSKEKPVILKQPLTTIVKQRPSWTGGTDVHDKSLRIRRVWEEIDKGDE